MSEEQVEDDASGSGSGNGDGKENMSPLGTGGTPTSARTLPRRESSTVLRETSELIHEWRSGAPLIRLSDIALYDGTGIRVSRWLQSATNTLQLMGATPDTWVGHVSTRLRRGPFEAWEDFYVHSLRAGRTPTFMDFQAFLEDRFGARHDVTDAFERVVTTRWSDSGGANDLDRHIQVFQDARLICDVALLPKAALIDRFLASLPLEYRSELWWYHCDTTPRSSSPEPSVPTPSPSITVPSPRQFAHFIRQDGVTFFIVNVTDLLHYDIPCPDAKLILLEPNPPSIFMVPISTFVPPPSVKSTPSLRADADAEELARYTADLEPAVRDLIREYHDVFPSSFSYAGIPPMRDVEHSIQLVPDYRVHHPTPYRLSIPEATELKRQFEELLRLGFIKPSNSPWGEPVLFARKADGTLRLCIDYRGLNRYTVKNSYLMPRSDELFNRLAGNRFFTKIDLRSGYHQIRVAAADQPKTAFRSRFGHYEFTVMPFGLTNAPATFQRAMNDIFKDILEQYVFVYLDDILVYIRTLVEHLRHLCDVLDRLRRHGFYAKLSKSRFAQHKVNFLGHYVSHQGLHMDDAKITAIAESPVPTSAKQLCNFLGLTSYYSFSDKPKLTPRQARWWRDLSEFSFTSEHIKGETNQVADAFSRRLDHDQEQIHLSSISVTTVHHSVINGFRTQYRHCPDYRDIHATLRSGKTVSNYSLGNNGLVYWHGSQGTREPRICVTSTGQLRVRAVAEFYDQAAAGHMSFHKTLARASRLYVWPKRKDFVKDHVAECPTCQEMNSEYHLPHGLLQPLPIPKGRLQSISMDLIDPLRPPTPRHHDAILVVVERFTKRVRFVPCRYAISAHEIAEIVFDRVVRDHDLPLSIIFDRDSRFTSRFWRRLYEVYDTHLRFSSSYHPQTDGQTEVMNKTLGDILRKIVRDDQ
ncbi:hypothetical protein CBR_g32685 [Chara braunii]|uniref:Integrase catalytic domain-containing protein n=1 Tax=Chara braunii TaxID=69332 RepID=A0A388LH75_CHABU|nr:hypothetical protein CBR_g32685 [Chara braunii]|eukprot:GBG81690.1 hypothetical protein CBR_g32685 [Chara braunii]